ncbi:MAG: enoyl-CoA hydratase [Hyphomicrobiales bacterium]|nr:enoyl-CoA hydratase [Hyphomicrobiales bacterium]
MTEHATDHLVVTRDAGVTTLTMNRPKTLNALSMDMRHAMFDAIDQIEHDSSIRCVILRGAGGNFMAGGDIKNFAEHTNMPPDQRASYFERRVHSIQPMLISLQRMKKPVIASVEGAAAGIGMSLMMACDLAIGTTGSIYRFAYSGIGASPDGSGTYNLPRIVGTRRALELSMLADRIDAQTAYNYGLLNFLVTPQDIESETKKLADRLANSATRSMAAIKDLIYSSHANTLETQLAKEARYFGKCAATDDWVEGVNAFIEKRKPDFRGK